MNKENLSLIEYFKFTYKSLKYNYNKPISADGTSSYKKKIFNTKENKYGEIIKIIMTIH